MEFFAMDRIDGVEVALNLQGVLQNQTTTSLTNTLMAN